MRSAARRRATALSLVGLLVLVGCARSPRSQLNSELADREEAIPSCEASGCADEVAALVAALRELPGVVKVLDPQYHPKQITDGAAVSGGLVVETGVECRSLEEDIAELGWRSSVSPLSAVELDCGTPGTDPVQRDAGYAFTPVRPTSEAQLKEWGDRGTLEPRGAGAP